jgi:hypothetical protein
MWQFNWPFSRFLTWGLSEVIPLLGGSTGEGGETKFHQIEFSPEPEETRIERDLFSVTALVIDGFNLRIARATIVATTGLTIQESFLARS